MGFAGVAFQSRAASLAELQHCPQFHDAILTLADGAMFSAPACLLYARSKWFRRAWEDAPGSGFGKCVEITIPPVPGGMDAFESILQYCYGLPVNADATNALQLLCCAAFFEMCEGSEEDSLQRQAWRYINEYVLNEWEDSLRLLETVARDELVMREALKLDLPLHASACVAGTCAIPSTHTRPPAHSILFPHPPPLSPSPSRPASPFHPSLVFIRFILFIFSCSERSSHAPQPHLLALIACLPLHYHVIPVPSRTHAYVSPAPPLHHPCTTPAPPLHHPCTTPAPPLHHPCTTPPHHTDPRADHLSAMLSGPFDDPTRMAALHHLLARLAALPAPVLACVLQACRQASVSFVRIGNCLAALSHSCLFQHIPSLTAAATAAATAGGDGDVAAEKAAAGGGEARSSTGLSSSGGSERRVASGGGEAYKVVCGEEGAEEAEEREEVGRAMLFEYACSEALEHAAAMQDLHHRPPAAAAVGGGGVGAEGGASAAAAAAQQQALRRQQKGGLRSSTRYMPSVQYLIVLLKHCVALQEGHALTDAHGQGHGDQLGGVGKTRNSASLQGDSLQGKEGPRHPVNSKGVQRASSVQRVGGRGVRGGAGAVSSGLRETKSDTDVPSSELAIASSKGDGMGESVRAGVGRRKELLFSRLAHRVTAMPTALSLADLVERERRGRQERALQQAALEVESVRAASTRLALETAQGMASDPCPWETLQHRGLDADMLVDIDGVSWPLHRHVLLPHCPLIHSLLPAATAATATASTVEEEQGCMPLTPLALATGLPIVALSGFPGGPRSFSIIARWCYGSRPKLSPSQAAAVLFAARFLGMEDRGSDALIPVAVRAVKGGLAEGWEACFDILDRCYHDQVLDALVAEFSLNRHFVDSATSQCCPAPGGL
ncbi:unnamed protein product [Closterium sp. Yama58-4]|nr:unnamed protein product [Closterium sp. Yama58-4]